MNCTIPEITVRTLYQIPIAVEDVWNDEEIAAHVSVILDEIIAASENDLVTLEDGIVWLWFEDFHGVSRKIVSDVRVAVEAYRSGLTGLDLVAAMGGFQS